MTKGLARLRGRASPRRRTQRPRLVTTWNSEADFTPFLEAREMSCAWTGTGLGGSLTDVGRIGMWLVGSGGLGLVEFVPRMDGSEAWVAGHFEICTV